MNPREEFTVTEDHIKLLQEMYIDWDDSAYDGAPAVNLKRPYGNSDVLGDIHEALTGEYPDWDGEDGNCPDEDAYLALHRGMETVLQILVKHPTSFTEGTYVKEDYTVDWKKK